jgi:hypothetical protein
LLLIRDWTKLEELRLSGKQVTDAGLPILSAMPSLERLTLRATSISDQGLKNLQQTLPNCEIEVRQGDLLYDIPRTSGPRDKP